jgi:hypothetical protein
VGKQEAQDQQEAPRLMIVEVRVLRDPEAGLLRQRIGAISGTRWRRGIFALALGLAVIAAAVTTGLSDRRVGRLDERPQVNARARFRGPAGVAAAYGYPLQCLTVTILTGHRTYARADFNRLRPCGRYTGYSTAIFRYAAGAWRPVLDAVDYLCPVKNLPTAVQTALGVCQ